MQPRAPHPLQRAVVLLAVLGVLVSCGDQGLLPTTVDPGADFIQEDVIFDEEFYYCRVEPVLFAQSCGSGVAGTDAANSCHYSVTSFRLTEYAPLVAEGGCDGDALAADAMPTIAARQNYTAAQARMKRDPSLAPLLQRPTGGAQHPRRIFELSTAEADVIRAWATQFSSQ